MLSVHRKEVWLVTTICNCKVEPSDDATRGVVHDEPILKEVHTRHIGAARNSNECTRECAIVHEDRERSAGANDRAGNCELTTLICESVIDDTRTTHRVTHDSAGECMNPFISVECSCDLICFEPPVNVVPAIHTSFGVNETDEPLAAGCITILHIQVIDNLYSCVPIQEQARIGSREATPDTEKVSSRATQDQCAAHALYPARGEGEGACDSRGFREVMEQGGSAHGLISAIERHKTASLCE